MWCNCHDIAALLRAWRPCPAAYPSWKKLLLRLWLLAKASLIQQHRNQLQCYSSSKCKRNKQLMIWKQRLMLSGNRYHLHVCSYDLSCGAMKKKTLDEWIYTFPYTYAGSHAGSVVLSISASTNCWQRSQPAPWPQNKAVKTAATACDECSKQRPTNHLFWCMFLVIYTSLCRSCIFSSCL